MAPRSRLEALPRICRKTCITPERCRARNSNCIVHPNVWHRPDEFRQRSACHDTRLRGRPGGGDQNSIRRHPASNTRSSPNNWATSTCPKGSAARYRTGGPEYQLAALTTLPPPEPGPRLLIEILRGNVKISARASQSRQNRASLLTDISLMCSVVIFSDKERRCAWECRDRESHRW